MYQDNNYEIIIEKNGKKSISKRTKHIKIRYFSITKCIRQRELEDKYCPTEDMIKD